MANPALGHRALVAQANLTDGTEVAAMMAATRHEFGQIDVLVLNASGGLEKGQPSEYAMQLNLFAQMSIVDAALPLIPRSGRIIFVTSHMVHF